MRTENLVILRTALRASPLASVFGPRSLKHAVWYNITNTVSISFLFRACSVSKRRQMLALRAQRRMKMSIKGSQFSVFAYVLICDICGCLFDDRGVALMYRSKDNGN